MDAVRRSWSTRGLASSARTSFAVKSLLAAMAIAVVPACGGDTDPPGSCTSSSDCTRGRVCRDNTCVVPAGIDGGPDAPLPPGTDTGTAPDVYFEVPTDAGMIEMPDTSMGWSATDDSDGDTIGDFDEGRATAVDTDGDGTLDYLDTDSDGDGVDDALEAGDAMITTPPVDTDADGTYDFRDLDADGNGVTDAIEGGGDIDGDGRPNSRDRDNDGDGLLDTVEIGFDPTSPRDTNSDGVADYNTRDSDGDTITDTEEELVDTDGDGIADSVDLDSDNDTILDSREAGDASLDTPAVDTDGDTFPDFRDTDSDGDGLSDESERGYGTSPTTPDTDGDGVSDLIEIGAGTSPTDGSVSPRTRGDFVFLVPYMQPADPARDTLQFSTNLQRADVYFLMDTTGSMGGEIANLRASLASIIPTVRARIPEANFGVGAFDDYPYGSYGSASTGDRPFYQQTVMTADTMTAQTAVNALGTHYGGDWEESSVAAVWSLVTGVALGYGSTTRSCPAGTIGMACFRPDAVPVIVMITDAPGHNYPGFIAYSGPTPTPPSWPTALAALTAANARVVGINSGADYRPTDVRAYLLALASGTGTVDAGGSAAPFVFDISADGSGLGPAIVDAIAAAALVPLDVSARAVDVAEAGETVDAVAAFVDHLEPNATGAPGLTCTGGFATSDYVGMDGDSFPDTFLRVRPGAPVCFDIIPKMNDTVPATLVPQVFRAQINVIGDGFTPLDDRVVYFLVPPRIPDPNE